MIRIRDVQERDLPAMLEIYNQIIRDTKAVWKTQETNLAERKVWFTKLKKDNFPILLAEKQKELVGFCSLNHFRVGEGYFTTAEHTVHTSANHRNQGIGRALMKQIILRAKQMKLHCIVGGIDGSNQVAHKFHQSLGFQNCGELPETGKKFGKWLNLTFYCLIL